MIDDVASASFVASFPPIQCIKFLGDGGARIVLDIPQSDEGAVETLRQWRGMALMVVVTPIKESPGYRAEQGDGEKQHDVAARPKRQPKWET